MSRVTCGDAHRSVQPSLTRPGERRKKREEKKRKKVVLHLWRILNSLSGIPPLLPRDPPYGTQRVYFHTRPLHFLTSSRLTSSLKRGHDSLKRSTHRSSTTDHTTLGREGTKTGTPVPAQPVPLSSMLDQRPVKEEVATKKGA